MALTAEQQAVIQQEIDEQVFRLTAEAESGLYTKQQARDGVNRQIDLGMEQRRAKLEAVRLAKEILMENDRNKPTAERGVVASDVTAFADDLINYINQ